MITVSDAQAADLVVVMDETQSWAVRALYGGNGQAILLLGDLDPHAIETRAIRDPDAQAREVCEQSYTRIERCIEQLVETLSGVADARDPVGVVA